MGAYFISFGFECIGEFELPLDIFDNFESLHLKMFQFQKNHVLFERFECGIKPGVTFATVECDVRKISQRDMKMHMRINFSEPMNDLWLHGVFYYRYNAHSYRKFPIDVWEDICAWIGRGTHHQTYFLKWTGQNVRRFSNMNHSCPYSGSVLIKVDRIPVNSLIMLPFMPAGRYRVDLNLTRGYRKSSFMINKFFFSISDNRVEQF